MHKNLKKEIWQLAIWVIVSLVVGWIIGFPFQLLSLTLLVFIAIQFRTAHQLYNWVKNSLKKKPPEVSGIWKPTALELHSFRQKQKKNIQKMRKTVHRISQLTHSINEGIVVLKPNFNLDWWNVAAGKLLGLHRKDKGITLTNLIRDPDFLDYLENGENESRLELPSVLDPLRWLRFTQTRLSDGDIVLVVSDVTKVKNVERMRKDFVGNVSHELRTPLTVLRGYLETLTDGDLLDNPQVLRACTQMTDQVLRMQAMADDLIVLSRLETQPEKLELEDVELQPFLEKLVEEARMVSEGSHKITLECGSDLSFQSNPKDLHSALGNLIVNAVKHNPAGTEVAVKAKLEDDAIVIEVQDNGVGIASEVIPRLTERFFRADSSRNSSKGGTGLGLAIVKHIVGRYGGTLHIESKLGEGTSFICRFPQS